RCVELLRQLRGDGDVVVVRVGAHDGLHAAAGDGVDDRGGRVRRVDDDDFVLVAEDPDVVFDLPFTAIKGEGAGGDHVVDDQVALLADAAGGVVRIGAHGCFLPCLKGADDVRKCKWCARRTGVGGRREATEIPCKRPGQTQQAT